MPDNIKLDNLIALECVTFLSTRVIKPGECSQKIKFDLNAGTWSVNGHKAPIGTSYFPSNYTNGNSCIVLGVYDRSNIQHLETMVDDARKFMPSGSLFSYYDI